MRTILFIFLISCTIIISSCKKTDNIVESSLPQSGISFEPQRAKVGQKIKIFVQHSDINFKPDDQIFFNDCWNMADSIVGNTIYTFVPYIPNAPEDWKVRFGMHYKDSVYLVEGVLKVETEPGISPKTVTWNPVDPVSVAESFYFPKAYSLQYGWNGKKSNDTIYLTQKYPASESYGEYKLVFHDNGSGKLPELISAVKILYPDYLPIEPNTLRDTIKQVLVRIDKWGSDNVFSGRVFPQVGEFTSSGFKYLKSADHFLDKYTFYCTIKP
ncbi:MAG: hypothetical protein ACM3MI_08590 [Clostridiales bacterium]